MGKCRNKRSENWVCFFIAIIITLPLRLNQELGTEECQILNRKPAGLCEISDATIDEARRSPESFMALLETLSAQGKYDGIPFSEAIASMSPQQGKRLKAALKKLGKGKDLD